MNYRRKKNIFILIMFFLVLVIIINISYSFALIEESQVSNYGTYDQAKMIVKEVMKDYYIKGINIQYHNSRRKVPGLSPEDTTSQDIQYTVCSGYVYNVYNEAFKMTSLPVTTDGLIDAAREYYNDNNAIKDDHFLLYYENTIQGEKYAYNNNYNFSDFIEIIQPGDIFVFTGHAMIVYDVVIRENGKKDVLLLNSNGTSEINSRLYSTRSLSYSYNSNREKNNVVDTDIEGGIQYKWLGSFSSRFVNNTIYADDAITTNPGHPASKYNCNKKQLIYYTLDSQNNEYVAHGPKCDSTKSYIGAKNGIKVICENDEMFQSNVSIGSCESLETSIYDAELSCQMDECVVIRPFYNCNGSACFNYEISKTAYDNSTFRIEYPGIYVEKSINKGDNNSVYPNDELEYTIKITNKSNSVSNPDEIKDYNSFIVEETIDDNVYFLNSTGNGIIDGNILRWNINELAIGSTVQISYTVKVKPDIYENIISNGKIYSFSNPNASISTGEVSNLIIPKVSNPVNSYESCYNDAIQNQKVGLSLIDYVYNCARNIDLNFSNFNFEDLFSRKKTETDQIYFKSNIDDITLNYKNMILNNYWGGATIYRSNGEYFVSTLKWIGKAKNRKYTFNDIDFKDGDVLIYSIDYDTGLKNPYNNTNYVTPMSERYTNEQGIYAFIYINGRFVGVNGSNESIRNSFTYDYYNENMANLYQNYLNINDSDKEEIFKYINYETLLDKDYYIILRPELIIVEEESISIQSLPNKLNYYVHDYLDLDGLSINLNYNNGTYETLSLNKVNITGFDSDSIGSKTIIINYNGMETSFSIDVKAIDYIVTFNSNGGSSIASQMVNYNESAVIPNTPTRDGYTFIEWQLNGSTYDFNSPVTSNITLIALWLKNEIPQDKTLKEILKDNSYVVTNNLVSGFEIGVTVSGLKSKLGENSIIINTNNTIVSTGVEIRKGNESYIIVIKGDLTGDGKVNSADLLQMRKYLLGELELTGAYKEAGIIESVGTIKSLDLLRLRQYFLGKYTFK